MVNFLQGALSSLGRKYIMAVTGLLLGTFILFHAVGNSTLFQGKAALNAYAEQLHSLGPIIPLAELILLNIFLLHIIVGISVFWLNRQARGRYAVQNSAGGETWGSRTMPWTGLVILAFLFLHLFNVRFVDSTLLIADVVEKTLAHPVYTFCYIGGITALILHTSHGFWSLLQTLGVHHPRYNILMQGGACVLASLIALVFLGVIVLLW
ncbi:succinate dehydrogenase cytochrome b subunit [Desulfobulbus sp. TB]|nr:succinate dehydrogenase cytochrome b subunit [Desulfobulbus sp. TB]